MKTKITNFKVENFYTISVKTEEKLPLFEYCSAGDGEQILIVSRHLTLGWTELTSLDGETIKGSDYYLYRKGNYLTTLK